MPPCNIYLRKALKPRTLGQPAVRDGDAPAGARLGRAASPVRVCLRTPTRRPGQAHPLLGCHRCSQCGGLPRAEETLSRVHALRKVAQHVRRHRDAALSRGEVQHARVCGMPRRRAQLKQLRAVLGRVLAHQLCARRRRQQHLPAALVHWVCAQPGATLHCARSASAAQRACGGTSGLRDPASDHTRLLRDQRQ